jgi:hypothetical protein
MTTGRPPEPRPDPEPPEFVDQPDKVVRLTVMLKRLLEEVRQDDLGPGARARLRSVYETSMNELTGTISEDLQAELGRLSVSFDEPEPPSEGELRVAQAQLVGWLEGVVRGIQNALRAQSGARPQPPPGLGPPPEAGGEGPPSGTYL